MKTRMYLDVDGVLNAQNPSWHGRIERGHARAEGYEYRITWSPNLITRLRGLDVDLKWATTWRDNAAGNLADLIGYGKDAPVLHPNLDPSAATTFPSIFWKGEAILKEQRQESTPFVWLDDEIGPHQVALASSLGGLALPIDYWCGIRESDILRIEEYIEMHREPEED